MSNFFDDTMQGLLEAIRIEINERDDNKEIKLKRCPLCDGEAEIEYEETYSSHRYYFVRCQECNCRTDDHEDEPGRLKAIEEWNTRKPIEIIINKLEEENNRLKKLKNSFIALSDHEVCDIENAAYNYSINLVKKIGGLE